MSPAASVTVTPAMPRLAVTPHRVAAMAEQSRRASSSTSRGWVAWATRNSSPPIRAAITPGPLTSRIRAATSTITWSPTA
nr:hypothetical protein [Mycolicibacterium poriferae]